MVRRMGSMRSEDEEMKNIPCLWIVLPLPKTKSGNKYILVTIDHYAKAMVDHGAKTIAKFLEDDVICRYGVPKFVLTNNG